jgi:hypothetical protein
MTVNRRSQGGIETVTAAAANARRSQAGIETVTAAAAKIRLTMIGIEVVSPSTASASARRRVLVLIE